MKPKVVVLLQITAICSVIVHEMLDSSLNLNSMYSMVVVLIGGFLTAGGANAINMWYDGDIDREMKRTENRPIPRGVVSERSALLFGVFISIVGVAWFLVLSNEVAAFWASFSILFYVIIYSFWLKRRTPQNIVIGGIAGSTPPLIGWSVCEDNLEISTNSVFSFGESLFDLGGMMPWFMFVLIFLWTPPHFWALALYRSNDYERVGVPMMPNVRGPESTIREMKVYSLLLVLLSLSAPLSYGDLEEGYLYHVLGWTTLSLSVWYGSTVWRIDVSEKPDETGKIGSASYSFFVSMIYLALMFLVMVMASFGIIGAITGAIIAVASMSKAELSRV